MSAPTRIPIEARGRLTESDHLEALRVVQRRLSRRWEAPALFLGLPLLFVGMSMLGGLPLKHALIANVFWLVAGPLMLFVGLPLGIRRTVRIVARDNPAATAPQLYRFTESGFEERECPVEVSVGWSAITDAVETKNLLLLFTGRTSAYIVPLRALAAAGQVEAVRGKLREKLGDRARLAS